MFPAILVHTSEAKHDECKRGMSKDSRTHRVRFGDKIFTLYSDVLVYLAEGAEPRPQRMNVGAHNEITLADGRHFLFHRQTLVNLPDSDGEVQDLLLANMLALVTYLNFVNVIMDSDGDLKPNFAVLLTTMAGGVIEYPIQINAETDSSRDFTYIGWAPSDIRWINRGVFRMSAHQRMIDEFTNAIELASSAVRPHGQRIDHVYMSRQVIATATVDELTILRAENAKLKQQLAVIRSAVDGRETANSH